MATSFAKVLRPRSLRARLLAAYLAGMLLSAALVATGAWLLITPFNDYLLQRSVVEYTKAIARNVRFDPLGQPSRLENMEDDAWLFTSLRQEVALRVVDGQGRVVYPDATDGKALAPEGNAFDPARREFTLIQAGVPMHAATVALERGRTWYVQFALSDRFALRLWHSIGMPALFKGLLSICIVFLIVLMVVTHVILRRTLAPLRNVSKEARRVTPRTLHARLPALGLPIEIEPLVQAFNLVLERLQQGFQAQQDFLASAAHELKTPLALIRAQAELGTPDSGNEDIIKDVDRMARQIQQLLLLAEASEPQNYKIEPIDPRPTIEEVLHYMGRMADRHAVHLDLRIDDDVGRWNADRAALFTLLKNLLENAIQHTPSDGVVTLSVRSTGFGVSDQGPGVPAADLPKLFQRFWRAEGRRDSGAGLGLSICHEIAAAHQWKIEAGPGSEGLEVLVAVMPCEDRPHRDARTSALTLPWSRRNPPRTNKRPQSNLGADRT